MFDIGDKVVYPHHGAAIVERREVKEAFGEKREYLVLRLAYGDLTLMVPADNTEGVGLREVINDEEVEEVFAVLRKKEARMPTNWSRRYKNHSEKLRSGDIYQVAEVVRNLSIRDKDKGLSAGEKRMLQPGPADPRVRAHLRPRRGRRGGREASRRGAALTQPDRRPVAASSVGPTPVKVWAVVVAAGDGARFGGPKQFVEIGGRPLVDWSVDAARSVADGVVLVVPGDLARSASPGAHGADVVIAGGATRAESVRAGLGAVPPDTELIVVHDGARPLAAAALFRSVVDAVVAGAAAAIPGLALADTLKRVDAAGAVVSTVARHGLVAVQTPQAFRADVLRRAHAAGGDATDDAALVEAQGATVRVVPGDARNLKVTTPADLDLVRALVGG